MDSVDRKGLGPLVLEFDLEARGSETLDVILSTIGIAASEHCTPYFPNHLKNRKFGRLPVPRRADEKLPPTSP